MFLATVTTACAKRTGAAASLERRRREPARAISPELLAHASASPLSTRALSALACLCIVQTAPLRHCLAAQNENAAKIQQFWFRKKEKRYGALAALCARTTFNTVLQCLYVFVHGVICRVARQIVIAMLRKRFARENKKLSNLVGEIGTTLVAEQPLKVGDK